MSYCKSPQGDFGASEPRLQSPDTNLGQELNDPDHYVSLLAQQRPVLEQLGIRIVAADAYFAKKSFVDGMIQLNFSVVTRLRQDANLRYLYHGPRAHTGRPKKYDGKVDCQRIDKRRLRLFQQETHCCYSRDTLLLL